MGVGLDVHRGVVEVAEADAKAFFDEDDGHVGNAQADAVYALEGAVDFGRTPVLPDEGGVSLELLDDKGGRLLGGAWRSVDVSWPLGEPGEEAGQCFEGHLVDAIGVKVAKVLLDVVRDGPDELGFGTAIETGGEGEGVGIGGD